MRRCEATERQFLDLLRAAAGERRSCSSSCSRLPSVPRGERRGRSSARAIATSPRCGTRQLDGLIVTGTEPQAANLKDEPYWAALTKLVDWARGNTDLDHLVVPCRACGGAARRRHRPRAAGREILRRVRLRGGRRASADRRPWPARCGCRIRAQRFAGAGAARGRLSRAHPLGRGRRRYLRQGSEACSCSFRAIRNTTATRCCANTAATSAASCAASASTYPDAPQHYFNGAAKFLADDFRTRAIGERRGDLLGDFPMEPLAAAIDNTWRDGAVGLYRNWIKYLKVRKPDRKPSALMEGSRRVSA